MVDRPRDYSFCFSGDVVAILACKTLWNYPEDLRARIVGGVNGVYKLTIPGDVPKENVHEFLGDWGDEIGNIPSACEHESEPEH